MSEKISYEHIRGLVEGEGCFTFTTSSQKIVGGKLIKSKVPAFSIAMHERDKALLIMVRDRLGLRNRIYVHKSFQGDGHMRAPKAFLIVREFGQLKNIIIPFFYGKLKGNKGKQFNEWLEKIGSDPLVSDHFKFLYKLHSWGYYTKNPKY